MTCNGCAGTVEKALASVKEIRKVTVSLEQSMAEVEVDQPLALTSLRQALSPYPSYQISENGHIEAPSPIGFWTDSHIWGRAALNTLNCLIGCSIGDFFMVIFLQGYYPGTPMALQMVLAIVAGLVTSVSLETILLHWREQFNWKLAFQTAISMSFLSMIAMELVMNATDFMITGGKAAFGNPMYWTALIVAMVAGFLAPLPYNYYKLRKFNKACH